MFDLIVRNNGKGSAYDVTFVLDEKFLNFSNPQDFNLHTLGIIKGIKLFPPGKEYRTIFSGQEVLNLKNEYPLGVSINYKSKENKKISENFQINPMEFWGLTYESTKNISDLVKVLDNIDKSIKKKN